MYASRYSFFTNISSFNFNYTYQIGSNSSDLKILLDQYATNIPKYLQDMEKDIIGVRAPVISALSKVSLNNFETAKKSVVQS